MPYTALGANESLPYGGVMWNDTDLYQRLGAPSQLTCALPAVGLFPGCQAAARCRAPPERRLLGARGALARAASR